MEHGRVNIQARKRKMSYVEVVTFPLEFSRGVDSVGHDPGDGFLNIFHPFGHLGVSHVIDLLDEGIILLPKRHLGNLFVSRT